jgi:hypothetical protein
VNFSPTNVPAMDEFYYKCLTSNRNPRWLPGK